MAKTPTPYIALLRTLSQLGSDAESTFFANPWDDGYYTWKSCVSAFAQYLEVTVADFDAATFLNSLNVSQ